MITLPRSDDTRARTTPRLSCLAECITSCGGRYIRCSIRHGEAALAALLRKLSSSHGRFLVGDWAVSDVSDTSCISTDGNFCLSVDVETKEKFAITLQLADEEAGSDISGSPFSVRKLVAAQGLDAAFGRSDHRKRKRASGEEWASNKRRRMER